MQLVEQHCINKSDPRYAVIDAAAFAAKNLYNRANYEVRQSFFHLGRYLDNVKVYHRVKQTEAYRGLPAKVSNDILRQLHKNWTAFFEAVKAYKEDPSKFTGRPHPPKYKPKEKGRFLLIYDKQAIGKRAFKKTGKIVPSGLGIQFDTAVPWEALDNVRIVPRGSHYVIEVVYTVKEQPAAVDPSVVAAIDLGVNHLAAITSNKPGFQPILVNGRPLKDLNHYYNQQRAHHQSHLARRHNRRSSHQLERITTKRNRCVHHYLHTASRRIIDLLVSEGIGTLVIGLNRGWKQQVEMGRRNNQTFVQIPHSRFIEMLQYKAQLVGMVVIVREESYTSKASFLDLDPIPTYDPTCKEKPKFSGNRQTRGLYRAANGRRVQADINGSYNTLRKAFPHAFSQSLLRDGQEIGAPAVVPCRLKGKRREDSGSSVPATRQNHSLCHQLSEVLGTVDKYNKYISI